MIREISTRRNTTLQNGYLNLIRFLNDRGKFKIQDFYFNMDIHQYDV